MNYYMVFDVESCGLHGEGFAVGWVVVRGTEVMAEGLAVASPPVADDWVQANVLPQLPMATHKSPRQVRDAFWAVWMSWRSLSSLLAADVAWPVEARFLAACVDDDPTGRAWDGPYPLIDIASVRWARGYDPLETFDRLSNELPQHNPLADARQSARLLVEALLERPLP